MHHLLSSSSALFSWLHALSTVDPMQWTVVSSAYRERLPDITTCGMSGNHALLIFVYYINTIGLYCYERSNLLMNEKQKEKKKKKKRIQKDRRRKRSKWKTGILRKQELFLKTSKLPLNCVNNSLTVALGATWILLSSFRISFCVMQLEYTIRYTLLTRKWLVMKRNLICRNAIWLVIWLVRATYNSTRQQTGWVDYIWNISAPSSAMRLPVQMS